MAWPERVAIINLGWSEDYQGSEVVGAFGHLKKGEGHEKYNFVPDADGRYYAYIPPLGEHHSPPNPENAEGWLVFAVSKKPKDTGLTVVGWFENGTFVPDYPPRPDCERFGLDTGGNPFGYALAADSAVAIPLPLRHLKINGTHFKRSYAYLRGNNESEPWREKFLKALLEYRENYLDQGDKHEKTKLPSGNAGICADPEKRKEVETKSIEAAKKYFKEWKFVKSVETEKCGYDLLFSHGKTGQQMHVEVKGTRYPIPHFFMTHGELRHAEKHSKNDKGSKSKNVKRPIWRLAMVTNALDKPVVRDLTFAEMKKAFSFETYTWHATVKQ